MPWVTKFQEKILDGCKPPEGRYPWMSRITIRQDSLMGRALARPKGEGHGCPESISGSTRTMWRGVFMWQKAQLEWRSVQQCGIRFCTVTCPIQRICWFVSVPSNWGSNGTVVAASWVVFIPRSKMRRSIYCAMGRGEKGFAPLNDKYAGRSRLSGTFLWFVSFLEKKWTNHSTIIVRDDSPFVLIC